MDGTWTISELAERAGAVLAADGSAPVSGRVRDLPNERLIRWYTTIGLVDPPLGRRGRIALYGRRHLLQLVAVKRRQAAGRSIAEIQLELAAATDATLERIAALPRSPTTDGTRTRQGHAEADPANPAAKPTPPSSRHPERGTSPATPPSPPTTPTTPTPPPGAPPAATSAPRRSGGTPLDNDHPLPASTAPQQSPADAPTRAPATETTGGTPPADLPGEENDPARDNFWSRRPDVSFTETAVVGDYGAPGGPGETRPSVVQGVRLASGLTLLLDVPALSGDDLAAIETAARPLLDELHRRGLLTPAASPTIPPADPSRRFQ